jgi:glycosyltransferase involved in cell wall biosynthesis
VKEKSMKTATIIVPTFNRADMIPKAIETSINQTYPCEVIVCDHGSTDNTPEVVSKYKDKVRYIRREEDNGPIACWLDAIEQAKGEIIHFTYDDDWLDHTFMEKTIKLLDDDIAFVYSNVIIHNLNKGTERIGFKHPPNINPTNDIIKHLMTIRGPISPGCAIFRRSDALKNILREIPGAHGIYGKNSGVGEDLLLYLLTSLEYPKYFFLNEPLAHFAAHSGSITESSGLTGKRELLFESYGHARKYFLQRTGMAPLSAWEKFSHFVKWNYKGGDLFRQTNKKIRKFLKG